MLFLLGSELFRKLKININIHQILKYEPAKSDADDFYSFLRRPKGAVESGSAAGSLGKGKREERRLKPELRGAFILLLMRRR